MKRNPDYDKFISVFSDFCFAREFTQRQAAEFFDINLSTVNRLLAGAVCEAATMLKVLRTLDRVHYAKRDCSVCQGTGKIVTLGVDLEQSK